MLDNYVRLKGRLGKDIEIKMAGNHKVAQISMAVRKNKDESEWFDVNCWDQQAEYLDRFAKKGSLVEIAGRLAKGKYQDKEGKYHNQVLINANEVAILSDWKKAGNSKEVIIEDEELPFY